MISSQLLLLVPSRLPYCTVKISGKIVRTFLSLWYIHLIQECIPVGCVPSAAVAVSWGGVPGPGGWVYLVPAGVPGSGGCTWSQGVYLVWGVYLVPGGVPGPRGVYLVPGGCTWLGGYLVQGGVPGPGEGGVPGPGGCTWSWGCTWSRGVHLVRYSTLPPVERQTPVKT